jgi:predicted lipoprotein
METMLANMIGLKPQEMKEMAERIQSGFLEMAGAINRIENNTVAILAALEEQNAGRKQLTNGSDNLDPGTRRPKIDGTVNRSN